MSSVRSGRRPIGEKTRVTGRRTRLNFAAFVGERLDGWRRKNQPGFRFEIYPPSMVFHSRANRVRTMKFLKLR